jgi:site-specific DNA-methyltransferase (adenine-specific)
MIQLYNQDCLDAMRGMKDNEFDLAIVDPPYGLGKRTTDGGGVNSQIRFMDDIRRSNWDDKIPSDEYFDQLKRVCKNYIVWGGNYFPLSCYRTFIVWDKENHLPTMSQVELAVTSFDKPARLVKISSTQKDRFHPTQKPVALYLWLLQKYAQSGDKILDTHLGSGSSALAAHDLGFDFVGYELDTEYYDKAQERLRQHQRQLSLFEDAVC